MYNLGLNCLPGHVKQFLLFYYKVNRGREGLECLGEFDNTPVFCRNCSHSMDCHSPETVNLACSFMSVFAKIMLITTTCLSLRASMKTLAYDIHGLS